MKKLLLTLFAICIVFPALNLSCKKEDVTDRTRVYFTYRIGYYQTEQQQCIAGDGLCDFEIKENWKPSGPMPEGYGFGYLTLNSKFKLQMVVYLPFLSVSTYKAHYEDGVASLPGPWRVAAEITTKLGLIDGYSVSVGDYKVELGTEDGYEVLIITF